MLMPVHFNNKQLQTYTIHVHVPSSSCLKIIVVGISIIGDMLPSTKELFSDVLVTVGN